MKLKNENFIAIILIFIFNCSWLSVHHLDMYVFSYIASVMSYIQDLPFVPKKDQVRRSDVPSGMLGRISIEDFLKQKKVFCRSLC